MHTKVQAALENTNYKVHRHADFAGPIKTPADFAKALGYPLERITKTVFLRSQDSLVSMLAVCSVNRKLDLPTLADIVGCKRLELASRTELANQLDYPPTGVSPLGVATIPIFMDNNLFELTSLLVGSGMVAVEIEIAPGDLQKLTNAAIKKITIDE